MPGALELPQGQGETATVPWSHCQRPKLGCGPYAEFLCGIATLLWTLWLNFMDEFYAVESEPDSAERLFAQP